MKKAIGLGLAVLCGFAVTAGACGGESASTTMGSGGGATHTSSQTTATSSSSGQGGAGGGGGILPAPGASIKCESSGKNAVDTYGVMTFIAINQAIAANVVNEYGAHGGTNIGDSFTKVGTGVPPSTKDDLSTFLGKNAAYLVYAFGGPEDITYTDGKMYHGPQNLVAAHAGLKITDAQYTYYIANIITPAFKSSGIKNGAGGAADPDDIGTCIAPVVLDPGFQAQIVGH